MPLKRRELSSNAVLSGAGNKFLLVSQVSDCLRSRAREDLLKTKGLWVKIVKTKDLGEIVEATSGLESLSIPPIANNKGAMDGAPERFTLPHLKIEM